MSARRVLWCAVAVGLAWRAWLVLPAPTWLSAIYSFVLGAAPYGVVVAFARAALNRAVLALVAVVVLVSDLALGVVVTRASSSTAGVTLLLAPVGKALVLSVALSIWAVARALSRSQQTHGS